MSQQIKRFDPNDLFYVMAKKLSDYWSRGKRLIICNEGGSRGGKTFDTFDLITFICDHNRNINLDTYILRDTLTNNRDFTLKDWKKLQSINGIEMIGKESPKPEYKLFGNNIYFRGLDDEESTEGYPSDILFFNEALELNKSQVDGLIMRCRKLIIFDWNPKLTNHWVFDYEGRPDVLFTRTNYKNNKHLEQTVIDEIESYEPTEENTKNKTANLFRWRVYGLGLRTDHEGNVFNDSKLNKFDISEINIDNAVLIAYCDVADQGIDKLSFVIGALIYKKMYIIDVIYTQKGSDFYTPLIVEMFEKYQIQRAIFESNGQGLMYTKLLKTKLTDTNKRKISASPNSHNKHSRIIIQAETNIVPNFYFKRVHNGMYTDFMNDLLSYKHDKSYKVDDAPDSLAGLSFHATKLM